MLGAGGDTRSVLTIILGSARLGSESTDTYDTPVKRTIRVKTIVNTCARVTTSHVYRSFATPAGKAGEGGGGQGGVEREEGKEKKKEGRKSCYSQPDIFCISRKPTVSCTKNKLTAPKFTARDVRDSQQIIPAIIHVSMQRNV